MDKKPRIFLSFPYFIYHPLQQNFNNQLNYFLPLLLWWVICIGW